MGKFFNDILEQHKTFIEKQKMFFVASAPLSAEGHTPFAKGDGLFPGYLRSQPRGLHGY